MTTPFSRRESEREVEEERHKGAFHYHPQDSHPDASW